MTKTVGTTRDRLMLAIALVKEMGADTMELGCVGGEVFADLSMAMGCEPRVDLYPRDGGLDLLEWLEKQVDGVRVKAQLYPSRRATDADVARVQRAGGGRFLGVAA